QFIIAVRTQLPAVFPSPANMPLPPCRRRGHRFFPPGRKKTAEPGCLPLPINGGAANVPSVAHQMDKFRFGPKLMPRGSGAGVVRRLVDHQGLTPEVAVKIKDARDKARIGDWF